MKSEIEFLLPTPRYPGILWYYTETQNTQNLIKYTLLLVYYMHTKWNLEQCEMDEQSATAALQLHPDVI